MRTNEIASKSFNGKLYIVLRWVKKSASGGDGGGISDAETTQTKQRQEKQLARLAVPAARRRRNHTSKRQKKSVFRRCHCAFSLLCLPQPMCTHVLELLKLFLWARNAYLLQSLRYTTGRLLMELTTVLEASLLERFDQFFVNWVVELDQPPCLTRWRITVPTAYPT